MDYTLDDLEDDEEIEDEEYHKPRKRRASSYDRDKRRRREAFSDRDRRSEEYPPYPYPYPYPPPPPPRESSKPSIAGALLVLVAILGIIFGILIGFMGNVLANIEDSDLFGAEEKIDIKGKVIYDDGFAAENVTISIVGEPLSTQTDVWGKFEIFDVPAGKHKIQVEKDGYNTIIHKAFISSQGDIWTWTGGEGEERPTNEFEFKLNPGNDVENTGGYPPFEMISTMLFVCAIMAIIFSIIALIGGYFALKRKNFPIAIIGAILGIFSIGFFLGSILAVIALFLLILARHDFKKEERPMPDRYQNIPY